MINLDGDVVGINAYSYTRTGGFMELFLAIPIEPAVDMAGQIRNSGQVIRGWLGALIQACKPCPR